MAYIKVLKASECHYGFQYKTGVNEIPMISKRAYAGTGGKKPKERQRRTYGLFFTTLDNIEQYLHAGTHFRYVLDFEPSTFLFVQNGSYKSTKLVLGEKQTFESVLTLDTAFLRSFPKFAPPDRVWELLKADAGLLASVPDPPVHYQMRALITYVGRYQYDPDGDDTIVFGGPVKKEGAAAKARRLTISRMAVELGSLPISEHVLDLYEVHAELAPRTYMVEELETVRLKVEEPEEGGAPERRAGRVYTAEEIEKEISETIFREFSTVERGGLELRSLRISLNVTLRQMLFGVLKVITVSDAVLRHHMIFCKNFMTEGGDDAVGVLKYLSNKGMLTQTVADELVAQGIVRLPRGKLKRFIVQ